MFIYYGASSYRTAVLAKLNQRRVEVTMYLTVNERQPPTAHRGAFNQ